MRHTLPDEEEIDELGLTFLSSSEWEDGGMCAEFRLDDDRGWRFTVWRNWDGAKITWTAYRLGLEVYRNDFHGFSLFVRALRWRREEAAKKAARVDAIVQAVS